MTMRNATGSLGSSTASRMAKMTANVTMLSAIKKARVTFGIPDLPIKVILVRIDGCRQWTSRQK
jgi:hypothetical protein